MNRVTIGYVDSSEDRVRAALAARARYLTTGETALLLGVSTTTANRMCASGRLSAFRDADGQRWRITLSSVTDFAITSNWILNWENLDLE